MFKIKWVYITICLAACTIIYELLLINTLSFLTKNTLFWQTFGVASYMAGMGASSYFSGKMQTTLKKFQLIELILFIIGLSSPILILKISQHYKYFEFFLAMKNTNNAVLLLNEISKIYYGLFVFMIFIIGFLTGFEIPFIQDISKISNSKILSFHYLGVLFGTFIYIFILNPLFSFEMIFIQISIINFLIFIISFNNHKTKIGLMAVILLFLSSKNFINELKAEKRFLNQILYLIPEIPADTNFNNLKNEFEKIEHKIISYRTLYQNIDFIDKKSKKLYGDESSISLYLDNSFQFSSINEHLYHQGFAHIPFLLKTNHVSNVLVLGAGDGLLARELLKYNDIFITQVELDEKMIDLANNNIKINELNKNSLNDKKIKVIIGDGFAYAKNCNSRYDAIYIDFPYPKNHDLSKLYSKEIYKYIFNCLKKDGFAVMDGPLVEYGSRDENNYEKLLINNHIILNTLHNSSFNYILPYKIGEETFVFLSKQEINLNNLNKKCENCDNDVENEKNKIIEQKFIWEKNEKYINSIFSPKFGVFTNHFEAI